MRISEITDAQGQLELLRKVIDNTWTAIAQQAEQEKRAEVERKAQEKLKPRSKKSSKGTSIRIPTPPPPPTKKPQTPVAKQQPSPLNKPNPQLNQPPTNIAFNPKLASTPHHKPTATTPIKSQIGVKAGYFGKNIGTTEKEEEGDDRHSKNGIATLKK
jgi:hypothetical protein